MITHRRFDKHMRIFVTGGTGFVGSHFVRQALAAGHAVRALRRSLISEPRISLSPQPQWLTKSLPEVVAEDFVDCEVLVHLAAHTPNVPYDTLENCLNWNLTVPLQMFRVAEGAGLKRFVVAGTCFEYGRAGERYDFIPTDAPLEPTLSYPTSKAAASIAFIGFAAETGAQLSIHRIFQVFGEGESENRLWPSLRRAALAGEDMTMTPGEQIRDFVPVEQVASALLDACTNMAVQPGVAAIVNVGTGQPQTVRQFAETWWAKWSATGKLHFGVHPYRDGEVMRYVPLVDSPAQVSHTI
jgi:nucleoside-diphosphate-sugar epimerase